MGATITLRGEGGSEFEYELPLDAVHTEQVAAGKLRPVDDDGAEALASIAPPPELDDDSGEPLTLAERIAGIASHADANALAQELGVDGFQEKKPSLDAKREALTAAAEAQQ